MSSCFVKNYVLPNHKPIFEDHYKKVIDVSMLDEIFYIYSLSIKITFLLIRFKNSSRLKLFTG